MLQFFLELTIALLAVYGAYTALHEIVAMLEKLVCSKTPKSKMNHINPQGKEDAHGESGTTGRDDHIRGDD